MVSFKLPPPPRNPYRCRPSSLRPTPLPLQYTPCFPAFFIKFSVYFYLLNPHSFAHCPRGRILGRNPDKSLKSLPPCYSESPLQLYFEVLFLQTHATSYSFYSSLTVYCKEERRKNWEKTIPPSHWFKKSIESESSQDYAQKPQRNCMFTNSASVFLSSLPSILYTYITHTVCIKWLPSPQQTANS